MDAPTIVVPPPTTAGGQAAPRYVIAGGGLAGGLIALALVQAQRAVAVTLLERDTALGGNHTWSFHDSDLDDDGHRLVDGLVAYRWAQHSVKFPGYTRTLRSGYATISSASFAGILHLHLLAHGVDVRLGTQVTDVAASQVRLDDGAIVEGDLIIDARGPLPSDARAGYQKFVGLEVELAADGPWTTPLLMDATVPQAGGYRFIYVLPFSARRALIEDTLYADNPLLDAEAGARAVLDYAAQAGAQVTRVARRETGVLPLPITAAEDGHGEALAAGYRGGFFHPVTGYSLPLAVRLALAIARAPTVSAARAAARALTDDLEPQARFGRLLNRLMFDGLPAAARRNAFERFYRLPEPTLARFYASRSTLADRARVLLGRPPAGISWRGLFGARPQTRPTRPQAELS